MIWLNRNSCIFELRLTYNSNEAITRTKTKREPTVASTGVIHMLRMCVGRRDSLPLFNQKSFNMRPTNDESATAQETSFVDLVKQNHKHYRTPLIHDLQNKPQSELISAFLNEMDCKNEAYFFILENDHFDSFKAYCQKKGGKS